MCTSLRVRSTLCAFSSAISQPKVVSSRHLSPHVTHKPRPLVAMERHLSSVATIILLVAFSAQVCVAGKCRIRKMSIAAVDIIHACAGFLNAVSVL